MQCQILLDDLNWYPPLLQSYLPYASYQQIHRILLLRCHRRHLPQRRYLIGLHQQLRQ